MLYSLNLLHKFISLRDDPKNIAKNLTQKTCEIEGVSIRTIPSDVVIGKVTNLYKHPNADNLFVCEVNCGTKGVYKICTGGENIKSQQYVPVALPGCYLPEVNLKIEPRTMRGEVSNGMICSKEELGIKEDTDKHRIWLLGEDFDDITDTDCGCPLVEKYPRLANAIRDVDNKAINNRPDLTGHFGLANELYALYKKEKAIAFQTIVNVREQVQPGNIIPLLENAKKTDTLKVMIQSPYVRSYMLIKIDNVNVRESSFYTRLHMLDLGVKPRNNRVDVSNIFMNLYGQPVHFFDADTIQGNIIVRQAKNGEEFVDLFDKKHVLSENDIVIADEEKILALAGVIGGKCSGVTEKTKNIAIELANFDPVCIRKTSQRYGLRTDAVIRYEKNINPVRTLNLFPLLLDTLKEYEKDLGSFAFSGIQWRIHADGKQRLYTPLCIDIDMDKVGKILFGCSRNELNKTQEYNGVSVKKLQEHLLEQLTYVGFTVSKKSQQKTQKSSKKNASLLYTIEVPSRRGPADIKIPEDVYEEIARLYGYEKIPLIAPPALLIQQNGKYGVPDFSPIVSLIRKVEDILIQEYHYDQVETYPWVDQDLLKACKRSQTKDMLPDFSDLLSLQNSLTPETSYIRDSMIYNLLGCVRKNHKFFDELFLFDIGKVWKKTENASEAFLDLPTCEYLPHTVAEHRQVGLIAYRKKITHRKEDLLLFMKQVLEAIGKKVGINFAFIQTTYEQFHPKKQGNVVILEEKEKSAHVKTKNTNPLVGFLGQVHPLTLQNLKIHEEGQVVYAELDLSMMLGWLPHVSETKTNTYLTLTDQLISRDLCFVIPKNASYKAVIDAVKNTTGVYDVRVFDIFNLEDKKSISLTIDILGDGTYTTNEINAIMHACIENAEKTGAKLRE